MVTTLEVLERSVYYALLRSALQMGVTVDPLNYYPVTEESLQQFKEDVEKLNPYVPIFGASNAQSKGPKIPPRIVVDSHGFYPGTIGMPKQHIQSSEQGLEVIEYPFETLDEFIDIRLVSGNQSDNRLLHNVLFHSIPRKGYIPSWPETNTKSTGNIFIQMVNFFDTPDVEYGLIEKVYQFSILDCLVTENNIGELIPIKEINIILENLQTSLIIK